MLLYFYVNWIELFLLPLQKELLDSMTALYCLASNPKCRETFYAPFTVREQAAYDNIDNIKVPGIMIAVCNRYLSVYKMNV